MKASKAANHQIFSGQRSISILIPEGDSDFLSWCIDAGIISAGWAKMLEEQVSQEDTQVTVSFETPGVTVIE